MAEGARPAALQVLSRLDADEAGRSAVDLARHLRQAGWRAFVASADELPARGLGEAGATHLRLPLDRADRFSLWRNAGRLRRVMRAHRIGLVHAHSAGPAWSAVRAARTTGAPVVTTCHALPPTGAGARSRFEDGLTAGDRVIAVSDYMAGELAARASVDPRRLRVVRRWVDLAEFDPARVRGHRVGGLAERCGIAAGTRVVVLPEDVEPGRGHLVLIEAVAAMQRHDFEVLFLGAADAEAPYVREVLARVRARRLEGRVRFAGKVADLPAALVLADVVVLPATSPDPSGALAAAAQAMGRPLIVSDQGALADSIMPAATGWLVPSGDAAELARALELALALDADVRTRLAKRARTFAAETFDMAALCTRTLDIYGELVRPADRSPAKSSGRLAMVE